MTWDPGHEACRNLLILPLLGGFLFLELCHVYRFRFQRLEGYRLLMWSAI